MLFHTWVFFVFFLVVYPVFLVIRSNNRLMNLWLMAASYVCVPVAFVAAAVFAVLFLLKRTRNDPSDGGRRGRPPER